LQIDQKGREENLSNAFAGVVKETNLPFIRWIEKRVLDSINYFNRGTTNII
jgi:hypothetical protein